MKRRNLVQKLNDIVRRRCMYLKDTLLSACLVLGEHLVPDILHVL
jgi:hypothetical protein